MSGSFYLVTGGAGFIGSNIVDELLQRGHKVRVIDNFSTGRRQNLAHVINDIELLEGDIRSYERVHNAVKRTDFVIHEAALPSVPRSVQDPLTSNQTNVTGTLNVLLAARDADVKRVIIASSSSVYGANNILPKREDLQPMPISPYGVSKLAAEQYCMAFKHVYGLETVALRYFNVFGPRQDPASHYSAVIPKFIFAALNDQKPVIYGDGEQTRDFTFVSNVVEATLAAAVASSVAGEIVNVACGKAFSLLELAEFIGLATKETIKLSFVPPRAGDVKHSRADISKACKLLGYKSKVSFKQGVKRTVESFS